MPLIAFVPNSECPKLAKDNTGTQCTLDTSEMIGDKVSGFVSQTAFG